MSSVLSSRKYTFIHSQQSNYQLNNYKSVKGEFHKIYNNLRKYDIQKFTTPLWDKNNQIIEAEFLPFPPFSFLNHPVIRGTMFVPSHVKWIKEELKFIESKTRNEDLRYFLLEDYIGMPELSNLRYKTSNTTIHHYYSLCKW